MVWRRGHPSVTPGRVGLVALLLVAPLAGCLGGAPPPDTEIAPFQPVVEDPAPLPQIHLDADLRGTRLHLGVRLGGDPAAVAGWQVDFGDGERRTRQGAPPSTVTYDYTPLRDKHADPVPRTIRLTLYSHAGRELDANTTVTLQPPPNRPPETALDANVEGGPAPLLTIFTARMSDTDGKVASWQLDFGDGTPPLRGTAAPDHPLRHEYRRLGAHTATLLVRDDTGDATTATIKVRVDPPPSRIWTFDQDSGNITLYDATGNTIARHNTTGPPCGPLGCGRPIGVAATADAAHVLVVRDGTNSTVWRLDPVRGQSHGNVTVGEGAEKILADTAGNVWVLHRDGNVSRIGAAGEDRTATGLAGPDKTIFTDTRATALFVAEHGAVGRIVRIDTETLQVDPLPFLVPDLRHAAYEDRHASLVATDGAGRVFVASTTLWGPLLQGATDTGTPVTALACRAGAGTCFVAHAATNTTPARLAAFTSDPGATDVVAAGGTVATLPVGVRPVSVVPLHEVVVVAMGGDASGYAVVADDVRVVTPYQDDAPRGSTPHAHHPRLVYHLDPGGRWAVFDAEHAEVSFRAATSAPGADGIAVAYPPRSLA